jgi:hypothetical protein
VDSRSAVHDDQIRSFERAKHLVQERWLIDVEKAGVGVKAFADSALAVEDEIKLPLHSSPGLANLILAMRGLLCAAALSWDDSW